MTNAGAVGLIGLGEIGQVHAAAICRPRAARLAAVADTVPERLKPFVAEGVPAYPDAGDVIADPRVGIVSVCLPHHLYFPVALAAIRAGLDVLVEKPLAVGLEQCEELVAAAAAAGVTLGVSHNQVFYAPHAEAKRLIDAGDIGRPVLIRLRLGMGPAWAAGGIPRPGAATACCPTQACTGSTSRCSSARSAMSTRSWTCRGNVGRPSPGRPGIRLRRPGHHRSQPPRTARDLR